MTGIEFTADGDPIPQGSARAFIVKGPRGPRAVITSDNPRLSAWRKVVAAAAVAALPDDWSPIDGPVSVDLMFRMPRPKTVRRDYPTGAREGDVDKLARAVLDALTTAQVFVDDSRVVRVVADQVYSDPEYDKPGVTVWVRPLIEGKK